MLISLFFQISFLFYHLIHHFKNEFIIFIIIDLLYLMNNLIEIF
jgi:hypothetical protein